MRGGFALWLTQEIFRPEMASVCGLDFLDFEERHPPWLKNTISTKKM
jgi:hypothetical protein